MESATFRRAKMEELLLSEPWLYITEGGTLF
jgi:hypothetical protein